MNFICFDTEDNSKELLASGRSGFEKQVTQIAARTAGGDDYYSRGDCTRFLGWLESRPEKFVYAHNLQYDLGGLFGDKLDVLDPIFVGGRLIRAGWQDKVFVDSFNLWPMSVKKLGDAFQLEKLATDSMASDKIYVFRDVEIIRQAMLFAWQFCHALKIGKCPATLGGLCVKVWHEIGGRNCHDTSEFAREALYGGRVELFKPCNDTPSICYTDINSLYPSQMLKDYPGPLAPWKNDFPTFGFINCQIKLPETELGLLPHRDGNGRITFPYGKLNGTWTVPELKHAILRGGKILKINKVFGSNEATRPYDTFVQKIYHKRLAAKTGAEKLFFKLLLNNLYGRLGASGVIARGVNQTKENFQNGVPYGGKVLLNCQLPASEETNWGHAAYVTSYGRLALLEYLELIGAHNMIYCDTDSTIFDCPDKKIPFGIGRELGQMKLESWEKHCETFAPKVYCVGNSYKAKGVPVRLAETFIKTGKASFDLPFRFRESIRFYDAREDLPANTKKLGVWRNIVKHKITNYDKKILRGNRYFPCEI